MFADASLAPYLAWLRIEPPVVLEPAFSPLWLRYQAVVDYDRTMVRISAGTHHCTTVVHFEQRQGLQWSMNTTIGVGENSIAILTVDGAGREVLASYQLSIRREARTAREPAWDAAQPHQVCGLRQVIIWHQIGL
ncbi:hypothetical protein R5R35_008855 [Gryllus longicercus]|uniref:Cadherin-like beta-sandwich-like domain-containing protein n=1 Tax=Gryllus longicercus TaxID=2509291 RepID=A0AAN9VAI7_9ORTH